MGPVSQSQQKTVPKIAKPNSELERQPFLTAPIERYVTVHVTDDGRTDIQVPVSMRGVSITARRNGRDWLIILVNEDPHSHMGVEVTGLDPLNGTEFVELYGDEKTSVSEGGFVTRMRPFEVKLSQHTENGRLISGG